METGLYLYCIRQKCNEPIEVNKTMSGDEKIQIFPFMDLEAVISDVSIEEFSSEEIQKKAEEDLEWIKGKAQIHEQVIEQAMRTGGSAIIPVIPMQFGVIFKTREKLQETLFTNLEKFRKSLRFLTGKQEWGVKAYLNQKVFEVFLEKGNEELMAKKREAEALPKGLSFFAKKKAASTIDEVKEKELDKIINEIYKSLAESVVSLHKAKILEKDFTLMTEEMILNGFYLIEESRLNEFRGKAEEFREKFNPRGIKIEMSGPWPSYHFI
ncbi:MAG TPA: hypothetical protein DEO70_07605 [Bacteroidales bacterium]|nr:MAG: hypothetical protein A2X11_15495 [Bacteroidetes bacterium GWE2_42_24]OFY29310.1 MAG: hypothetical protein A2X09_06345 [Bacteroidetes bacterium GWF2_43_11]HBZ66687.1 hypothetical protein [Bacteroidales bacterium]